MTVCVALASLIPILWETGVGADVMKPIAAPFVGGMITSTIHVLILVPVFFALMKERAASRDSATKRIARARLNVALSRALPLRQTRCGSRETHPFFTIRAIKKIVIDDLLAIEPLARAKNRVRQIISVDFQTI
jgi:hypothetical protein